MCVVFEHPAPTAGRDGDLGPLLVTAIRGGVPWGHSPLPGSQPAHCTRPEEGAAQPWLQGTAGAQGRLQEPPGRLQEAEEQFFYMIILFYAT